MPVEEEQRLECGSPGGTGRGRLVRHWLGSKDNQVAGAVEAMDRC